MTRATLILLVALGITVLLALADTLLSSAASSSGAIDLVASVSYALCAFAWVKADARARDVEPPRGAALLAALAIPIGVPVYLFRALGARGGAWATLKSLGFAAAVVLTYLSVFYIVYFVERFTGT